MTSAYSAFLARKAIIDPPSGLDVIERCIDLWSNPGDTALTPFLGVGSEVFCAIGMGRRGIGIELKPSYFAQAKMNVAGAGRGSAGLFDNACIIDGDAPR